MLSPRSFPRTSYGTYVYRARISSSPGRNLARVAGNNVNRDDIGRSSPRNVLYTHRRTRCGFVSILLSFRLTFSLSYSPSSFVCYFLPIFLCISLNLSFGLSLYSFSFSPVSVYVSPEFSIFLSSCFLVLYFSLYLHLSLSLYLLSLRSIYISS